MLLSVLVWMLLKMAATWRTSGVTPKPRWPRAPSASANSPAAPERTGASAAHLQPDSARRGPHRQSMCAISCLPDAPASVHGHDVHRCRHEQAARTCAHGAALFPQNPRAGRPALGSRLRCTGASGGMLSGTAVSAHRTVCSVRAPVHAAAGHAPW